MSKLRIIIGIILLGTPVWLLVGLLFYVLTVDGNWKPFLITLSITGILITTMVTGILLLNKEI